MDRDRMCNLQRETSIDASYPVSVHLAEGFQRRSLKCEKLTANGRQVMTKAHIAFGQYMEFIFLTEKEKPIDESDVDSDGEIDSESTEIGNSINKKVWGHLEDRWATIKVFFF